MTPDDVILTGTYATYDDRGRYAGRIQVLSYEARAVDGRTRLVYLCRWVGQGQRAEWDGRELARALSVPKVRA